MIRWALRSLLSEPVTLAVTTAGLVVAFFLVLLLEGTFEGESRQIVRYLEEAGADVWVMQEDVSNVHMALSTVSSSEVASVGAVEGVAGVTPILYLNTLVSVGDGEDWFAYVVGLRDDAASGGPWAMAEGVARPGPGEAVIPRVLALRGGVGLGDEIAIAEDAFEVVGLSEETFSMANSVVFLTWGDVADLMESTGVASYALVEAPSPGRSSTSRRSSWPTSRRATSTPSTGRT